MRVKRTHVRWMQIVWLWLSQLCELLAKWNIYCFNNFIFILSSQGNIEPGVKSALLEIVKLRNNGQSVIWSLVSMTAVNNNERSTIHETNQIINRWHLVKPKFYTTATVLLYFFVFIWGNPALDKIVFKIAEFASCGMDYLWFHIQCNIMLL